MSTRKQYEIAPDNFDVREQYYLCGETSNNLCLMEKCDEPDSVRLVYRNELQEVPTYEWAAVVVFGKLEAYDGFVANTPTKEYHYFIKDKYQVFVGDIIRLQTGGWVQVRSCTTDTSQATKLLRGRRVDIRDTINI